MMASIHSIVDFITNSSSETFIFPHSSTPDCIHTILNVVLKAAGSTVKSEDLFDITTRLNRKGLSRCIDNYIDSGHGNSDSIDNFDVDNSDFRDWCYDNDYAIEIATDLIITPKDNANITEDSCVQMTNLILGMLSSEYSEYLA